MTPADVAALGRAMASALDEVLIDKGPVHRLVIAVWLAGGHALFEDAPGVGKTTLCRAVAGVADTTFGRVQGTPDLLPSDVTGIELHDAATGSWTFEPGPVLNSVVLVDELNRMPPRSQSALLEVMAEGQVTVAGTTHRAPEGQLVLATQNPQGSGSFPLVDGQIDRFMAGLQLGGPSTAARRRLAAEPTGTRPVQTVCDAAAVIAAQAAVQRVEAVEPVIDYGLRILDEVDRRLVPLESARPTIDLFALSRSVAALRGRGEMWPDDVRVAAPTVFSHRVGLGDLGSAVDEVTSLVGELPIPSLPG